MCVAIETSLGGVVDKAGGRAAVLLALFCILSALFCNGVLIVVAARGLSTVPVPRPRPRGETY